MYFFCSVPPSKEEVSLGEEDFIVPEDPSDQERFKRRLIATARSLKKQQKKYTSVTFWAERIFFLSYIWHFYADHCDKTGITIDVVGSYFYDKKSWQKMGFSSWAGRRSSCMTIFGPSMTEKTVVEARERKISGCSRLRWVVEAERCTEVCVFLSYTYTHMCEALGSNWIRAIALATLLNLSDRSLGC